MVKIGLGLCEERLRNGATAVQISLNTDAIFAHAVAATRTGDKHKRPAPVMARAAWDDEQ